MADGYPKGSICLCADCWRPVFALERGISLGDKGGRAASAFRPVTQADLVDLTTRRDLNGKWQALIKGWMATGDAHRVLTADRPRSGDPCICPNCGGQWVKVQDREHGSAVDRGYELQLVHVPPIGMSPWLNRPRWGAADIPDISVEEKPGTLEEKAVSDG